MAANGIAAESGGKMQSGKIYTNCNNCGQKINAPQEYAGQYAKCPKCGSPILLPKPENEYQEEPSQYAFQADGNDPVSSEASKAVSKNVEDMSEKTAEPAAKPSGEHNNIVLPLKINPYIAKDEDILFFSRMSSIVLVFNMIWITVVLLPVVWDFYRADKIFGIIMFLGYLIALAIAYYQYKNTFYILTSCKVVACAGVFNYGIKMMPINKIETISINTGIIDRVLGTNNIVLANGAGGGLGIFSYIPMLNTPGAVNLKYVKKTPYVVQRISERLG